MNTNAALILIMIGLAAPVLGLMAAGVYGERRCAVRRRVVVNLLSGQALTGLLWARRGSMLILRDVTLLEAGGTQRVDGEAIVDRGQVAFIQAVSA